MPTSQNRWLDTKKTTISMPKTRIQNLDATKKISIPKKRSKNLDAKKKTSRYQLKKSPGSGASFRGGENGENVPRKAEEEGWPAKGAKRKKGRVKTGQEYNRANVPPYNGNDPRPPLVV